MSTAGLSATRCALLACILLAGRLCAADSSFTASFARDDDHSNYFVTLTNPGTVTVKTNSYASGGFDPNVSLFDGAGNFVASNADGGCANVAVSPDTGFCWDAYLSVSLPAGRYQVVITQADNLPAGPTLADGFAYDGDANFTNFTDAAGNQRTSAVGVDFTAQTSFQQQLLISQQTPPSGKVGAAYSYNFAATGGTQPYSWKATDTASLPSGLTLNTAGVLGGTPTAFGDFSFLVEVSDSGTTTMTARQQFQVHIAPADIVITTSQLSPGITGRAYGPVNFAATGGTSSSYNWSVSAGALPGGVTLSAAGALQGTPAAKGTYPFTVQATQGTQSATRQFTLNVYDALTITTSGLPSGIVGATYGGATAAASGGSGSFAWSAGGLPNGLSISSAGQISGVPSAPGIYNAALIATDTAAGQSATKTVQVNISYPALQISGPTSLPTIALGGSISGSFTGSGGQSPYRYSVGGLPQGVSIDESGLLSGTPTQAGNFSYSIQVTDSQPVSASLTGTLGILGIVTTGPLPSGSTSTAYSASVAAAGGQSPYIFTASGLPKGLSISSGGVITGKPIGAGPFTVVVQVTEGTGVSASASFALSITSSGPLHVSGGALSGGTVDSSYSDSLSATGGTTPYAWTVIGGTTPPGITVNGDGSVIGTPTAAGSYSFTAQVNGSAAGVFTVVVDPASVTLITSSFPNGVAGTEYPAQVLSGSGGVRPYTYAITLGDLPAGLSLVDGKIGGIPTDAGSSSFTITASDAASPAKTAKASFTIEVRPAQADLILTSSSAAFTIVKGASDVPVAAAFPVKSSVVLQLLNYTAATTKAVSWLDVTGDGTTPGTVTAALNSSAAALPASDTPYTTSIAVTCVAPSPCAGSVQNIGISLTVKAPPAQLSVTDTLLSFEAHTSNPTAAPATFGIQNKGGGTITVKSVTPSVSWITVSGAPSSLMAGLPSQITVGVNTNLLAPGYYRGTVDIATSAGTASVPVTLQYSQDAASISLNPTGTVFQMQAGGAPGNPSGSFQISVAGTTTVGYSVSAMPGTSWLLTGSGSGSATSTNPGTVNFSIDTTAAAALAPGAYYGILRVSSPDAGNSPQDFEVVLNVTPVTETVKPDPRPAGLVFVTTAGVTPAPQALTLFASSKSALNYQSSASTEDGGGWLSVSPSTGSTSAATPGHPTISVSPGKLGPGIYRGGVSYAFSSAGVRTVNVTLVIEREGAASQSRLTSKATGSCAATKLVPTQTGLVSNFAQPTSWPTPLSIRVVDDCGSAVTNGQVVTTFSNGDPPLALQANDKTSGIYSATWTPRASSQQMTITARATAGGFAAATTQISGQITPNTAPVLTPHGTLHVFDPLVGGALGPGNIIQIYGENLAADVNLAPSIPLPSKLAGTQVLIGGLPAPLYFVSKGQINAQIPFELTSGKSYQIVVSANGALTTPDNLQLTAVSPGIAAFASGQIIAQHLDATLSLVTEDAPARPGEYLVFYLAGLGMTDNPVVTGDASPSTNLARPLDAPVLSVDGKEVPVLFAGLTPGLVGLYQVNFQVPDSAPDGDLKLLIMQSGTASNTTILPVKKPVLP